MPYFILECSEELLVHHSIETILKYLHQVANHTELFEESDIQVRISPFKTYIVGNKKQPFIHVFAHIMAGKTDDEKANLSKMMIKRLAMMFPGVEHITMNVTEIAQEGYCELSMVQAPKEDKTAKDVKTSVDDKAVAKSDAKDETKDEPKDEKQQAAG